MSVRHPVKAALVLLLFVALAVTGYVIGRYFEAPDEEPRSVMTEGFGRYEEKIFKNKVFYKKTDITTLLIMGIDRDTTKSMSMYRNGGQSDFLLLLVIDHEDKQIRQLQINRDTMARIHVLGILGDNAGYRTLQICLSHAYGATQEACAENTVEAVSHYLDGIPIDLYMAVDYTAVPTINDMLGGVTVTMKTDFSHLDPEMGLGETVRLKGKQAEYYVRGRMSVGDGTNASRQLRQREWMNGARALLKEKVQNNSNFVNQMLDTLGNRLVTNVSAGRLINEFNASYHYEQCPVEEIPGEYRISKSDFVEYHTPADFVTLWVVENLYRPAEETDA